MTTLRFISLFCVLTLIGLSSAFAQDALFVDSTGDVGMGTNFPTTPLHVSRTDGTAMVLVENASSTTSIREMFRLENNGGPFFIFADTNLLESFSFAMVANGDFIINQQQTPGVELRLDADGNLTVKGVVNSGSSRAIKDQIVAVDPETVLAKVESLPVAEWSYETRLNQRHIGPMAEDFYATFGLGSDSKHIAPLDLAGVSLAAIKALEEENDALEAKNAKLEARLARQNERLSRLEALVIQ